MAWLDDRFWCHPKITGLGDRAYRAYVNGLTYSSGFSTKGVLTDSQQRAISTTPKARRELIDAALWIELPNGSVRIHDWDEHNGKRDQRRIADRERKRRERAKPSAGQKPDKPSDRRALTVVKEVTDEGQPTTDRTESPSSKARTEAVKTSSYDARETPDDEADDGTARDFQLSNYENLLRDMP